MTKEDHDGMDQPSHMDIMREVRYLRQDTHEWREDSKTWRLEQAVINTEVRAELRKNTAITESISGALQAGKAMTAMIKWLGYIAAAAVAIWSAWITFRGDIRP